jgi:hypothetical protein
MIEDV